MEAGRLLLEMGYTVSRKKIARAGQKTLLNALEVQEPPEAESGANLQVCDAEKCKPENGKSMPPR